jgi:hypothetical protein
MNTELIAEITVRLSGPYVAHLKSLSDEELLEIAYQIEERNAGWAKMSKAALVSEITADKGLYRRQLLAKSKPALIAYLVNKADTKAARNFA